MQIPTEQSRGDGQCFLTSSPPCLCRVNLALDNGAFANTSTKLIVQLIQIKNSAEQMRLSVSE